MRVLLVDQDVNGRASELRSALLRRGHEVTHAPEVEGAIARLGARAFDLVVLIDEAHDARLPALCAAARDGMAEVFILALVAPSRMELTAALLDAGVDDYSPLPFSAARFDARMRVVERTVEQRARRLAAELEREREHGLVEAVLEVSSSLIMVLDADARAVRFNRACEALTGLATRDVAGTQRWLDLIAEDERDGVRALFDKIVRGEFPVEYECSWRAHDGTPRRIAWQSTGLRGDDGAVRYVVATGVDVSATLKLQSRLLVADRLVSVGTLAAGVAHEINNPLTYVIANLEYASRLVDAPPAADVNAAAEARAKVRRSLAHAREGAERVRVIVKNLRTFSRGDEDRRGAVIIEDVVESAIDMAWNEIRHRARLVREFHPVPAVDANEARLGQVFLNLLVNAAQAIPEGHTSDHRIHVVTRPAGERVMVEITDTGVGIAPELVGRIFDPFFTTKPVGEGTGLGLSICHGIVTNLGGEILVESTPGRGSTFRVLLPVAVGARSERPMSVPPAAPGRRAKVLLVDDEANLRTSLAQILAGDHDVREVASGAEVLELLRGGARFDALLCDLMMPEMSGIDLFEAVEALDASQARRVIFLTGGAFTPRAQDFMARVPNPRLEKPFDIDELLRLIRKVMN